MRLTHIWIWIALRLSPRKYLSGKFCFSLYDRMSLRATFFLPIYCITSSTPKYLREKAYGGAVHDK